MEAFAQLLNTHPKYRADSSVRLVLLGGSRNAEDAARVEELRVLAKKLNIDVSGLCCMPGPTSYTDT